MSDDGCGGGIYGGDIVGGVRGSTVGVAAGWLCRKWTGGGLSRSGLVLFVPMFRGVGSRLVGGDRLRYRPSREGG